jgi:hypothetical protein
MFPPDTRGRFRRVRDLDELVRVSVAERAMFSELDVPWAKEIRTTTVTGSSYRRFPGVA